MRVPGMNKSSAPYRIVCRSAGAQQSAVALQVEVKFGGVGYITIYYCSSLAISTPIAISLVLREESVG